MKRGFLNGRRAQRAVNENLGYSTKFHDVRTGIETCDDLRETEAKPFEQKRGPAVSQSDPDQPCRRIGCGGKKKEIFIFAYDGHVAGRSMPPNYGVVRRFQCKLPYVSGDVALGFEKSGQSGRQLVINQEFHASVSTTWSA